MKIKLIIILILILTMRLINGQEKTDSAIQIKQGTPAFFSGWLIKEDRVKELLVYESNYFIQKDLLGLKDNEIDQLNKLIILINQDKDSYKELLAIKDQRINNFKDMESNYEKIISDKTTQNELLIKQNQSLKQGQIILIATTAICISVSVIITGGVIAYAIIEYNQRR